MYQPNWILAFASTIGSGHILEKKPCQDACKVECYDNFCITVVCDGAGSYQNSHIGSKQVAELCIYHFEKVITSKNWNYQKELPNHAIWHEAAKQTLFSIREDLDKFSMSNDLDFRSLACTVILTIALPQGLLVTHIGDGRAGYCNNNLEWYPTITPFHGELANETVFITSDIWNDDVIDNYIESKVIIDDVKAFCLLSDGCEKASFECNLFDKEKETYFDPNRPFPLFFNPNLRILPELYKQGKSQEEINSLWTRFLMSGNEKLKVETDDKTLILGVRFPEIINS